MSDTSSPSSGDVKYEQANVVQASTGTPIHTNAGSSQQRVVATSNTNDTVQLRFTPREVRQLAADAQTK